MRRRETRDPCLSSTNNAGGQSPHGTARLPLLLVVSGLIVGALARLALPGPDPMGIGMTILIGLAGSFIGGLVMYAITGTNGAGIVVSVAAATLIVYLIRRSRGRQHHRPGAGRAQALSAPLSGSRYG